MTILSIDLEEVLRSREIVHPCSITSVSCSWQDGLTASIVGVPWWLDNWRERTDFAEIDHEHAVLRFKGGNTGRVSPRSVLTFPGGDIELLEIWPTRKLRWFSRYEMTIYCNEPLPDPLAFYTKLEDYLRYIRCPIAPRSFINAGSRDTLSGFLELASSRSFLLFRGDKAIGDWVSKNLTKAGISNMTEHYKKRDVPKHLVWIEDAWLFCDEAFIEYDPSQFKVGTTS